MRPISFWTKWKSDLSQKNHIKNDDKCIEFNSILLKKQYKVWVLKQTIKKSNLSRERFRNGVIFRLSRVNDFLDAENTQNYRWQYDQVNLVLGLVRCCLFWGRWLLCEGRGLGRLWDWLWGNLSLWNWLWRLLSSRFCIFAHIRLNLFLRAEMYLHLSLLKHFPIVFT